MRCLGALRGLQLIKRQVNEVNIVNNLTQMCTWPNEQPAEVDCL